MLTPTEGVDFSNYLARVLASVKRNWYAVIPESARMGEKGMVVLQFRIMRDGNVPSPEPNMAASSGKEPLDRAAYSAIRSSSPFEPLPSAFSGPFIELRFYFLYNLPVEYATGK
jgi:TonB family protein